MLTKITVEAALNAELDDHLGFDKHEQSDTSNNRNGHTSKSCDPTDLAPFGSTDDLLNFKTEGQNSPDILIPSDNTANRANPVVDMIEDFTHAAGNFDNSYYEYTSRVVDSIFIGESDNIGNPRAPSEIAYGCSLPQPKIPDFPIRAYEFYDLFHELDNITFINAKPVYHPEMDNRWSNDDWGNVSYQSSVFNDADDSITGIPDSYIIISDGIDGRRPRDADSLMVSR